MKFLYYLSAHLRFGWLFAVLRSLRKIPLLKHLITLWDPNSIRKNVAVSLPERRVRVDFGTYRLWVNLNDHIGYNTYIRNEPFEMSVYRIGRKLNLSPNDIVLDIGANIGTASVPLCAETGCELIAVEASKHNAGLLAQNIFENHLTSKLLLVALVSAAYTTRYVSLYLRDGNTGANSLHTEWNPSVIDAGAERVPAETLDHLMKEEPVERIKLIKIDVEGAEADVLSGAAAFLAKCKAPILMEHRLDIMQKYLRSDLSEALGILQNTHHVMALDKQGALQDFDENASYENILFIPNERLAEITGLLASPPVSP